MRYICNYSFQERNFTNFKFSNMKKKHLLFFGILIFVGLSAFIMSPTGSPGGYTGSPGDGSNCVQCHGGSASNVTDWISADIPAEGYTPGQIYNITITVSGTGVKGFELTAEKDDNSKTGTFTSGTGSKLVNSNSAVTHSSSSSSDPESWSFQWTAPNAGSGNVTFYAACAVNKSVTKLCNLSVSENTVTFVSENNEQDINIYPNPVTNTLFLSEINEFDKIDIYDTKGALVYSAKVNKSETEIDFTNFKSGVYVVKLSGNGKTITRKITK